MSTIDVDDFNLEAEYGPLLDILEQTISDPDLKHYGVKGMQWGVRKSEKSTTKLKTLGPDSVTRTTSSGETITLKKVPPTKLHEFLGRRSDKYRESAANSANLTIQDSSGKKVGNATVFKKSESELNLVWLAIDKTARGQGYATQAMEAAQEFGIQQGFKKLTLEVPGNSPDARHIYEKLGFKVTKEADPDEEDFVWGGLTEMEYQIDKVKHMAEVDDFLAHYGVKGMRWGKRKSQDSGGSSRSAARTERKIERAQANVAKTKAYEESRAKGLKFESTAIKEARSKISAADAKYSIAKAEARVLRQTEGKAAVKKAIRSARLDRDLEYIRSERQASLKTGTEIVTDILFGVGGMAFGGPNARRN